MKIVDDAGKELPWDGKAFGDLKVRGPWVASAYYGEKPGSALDEGGWFATGDVATIDPEGFMEITDRSKDVIKSGGEWISSITLENIAVSHPDVAEAAVVAALHAKWDERPVLIVVPRAGRTIEPESVLALYEGQVPRWWLPDAVVVETELPHTATGKILKRRFGRGIGGICRGRGREGDTGHQRSDRVAVLSRLRIRPSVRHSRHQGGPADRDTGSGRHNVRDRQGQRRHAGRVPKLG